MSNKPPNFRENEGCFDCIHVEHIDNKDGHDESRCKKHDDYLVYGYNVCDDYVDEMANKEPPNLRDTDNCYTCTHSAGPNWDCLRCEKHDNHSVFPFQICDDFEKEPPSIVAVSDVWISSQMSEELRSNMGIKSCNDCEHFINASYEHQYRVFCKAKAGHVMYEQKFHWAPEYTMTQGPLYLPSEMLQTDCKDYKLFRAKGKK